MNEQQFTILQSQIAQLTPQQLQALLNQINAELAAGRKPLVTEEELKLISSLFH